MNSLIIQATNNGAVEGELLDLSGSSSIAVLSQSEVLGLSKGSFLIEAGGGVDLSRIFDGSTCVTDTSFAATDIAQPAAVVDQLMVGQLVETVQEHNHMSILDASSRLSALAGDIHKAFAGELSLPEMQALVDQLQSDLLDFYAQSNDIYGDIGDDVSVAGSQIHGLDIESLLASMQTDQLGLADFGNGHEALGSIASSATLDALFAVPHHIPLTMDFSDTAHVESVAEFFNSEISSISSQAGSGIDDGNGIDPTDLG